MIVTPIVTLTLPSFPRATRPGEGVAPRAAELRTLTGLRIVAAAWVVLFHFHFSPLDGVQSAREHGGRWTLEAQELARAVPALLNELTRRGLPLGELATHSATLEDVFVSLTGRQLRDV